MGIKSEPTRREGIFPNRPYHYVSILNRLIKSFRNTDHVEIGPMTYSRNSTISTTILSVNLVGMERKRKIGIDDHYNDEQSRVNLLVQVQQDHHPHRGHLVVSLHWSRLSQAQNGFTWNWWDLWGLWNITERDESSVWRYNPGNCVDEDEGERGLPPKLLESPINTLLRLSAPGGADLLLIDQHVHHHYHYHHYHPYSLCHQYHHYWILIVFSR